MPRVKSAITSYQTWVKTLTPVSTNYKKLFTGTVFNIDVALGNADYLKLLMDWLTKERSEENLKFLQAVKTNPKAVAARKAAGDKTVSADRAVDKAGLSASAGAPASAKAMAGESAGAGGGGGTGTNLQEQGVDEPDIAKTDGSRLLSLKGRRLTMATPL